MELSLLQNDIPVAFNNLTEDFNITIPGSPGHKPATTTITFPAPGNQSSSYHLLNLNSTAEGFLVTITPLNTSVVYGVWGRYGGRPGDQNYNVSTETYVLPEQCALMKTLSVDEDTGKTAATMFIPGEDRPVDYYIRVQVRGPVTECGIDKQADRKESHTSYPYSYQIQWARLNCVYWSETQEDWRTDGCTISEQSTITSTVCHCNHLTAFGSDFATPPNTLDFGRLDFSDLVDNGAVVTTVLVALCLYSLTSALMKIAERGGKRELHHTVRLDDLQNGYLYRLLIWTGAARHAGTESTVAFKLVGGEANSDVRLVNIAEKVFTRGSQVTLTFSTAEQLGNVEQLQLMHDNSGEGGRASWHVDRAAVEDLNTGKLSYFFCGEWLAADCGDGQVVKTFPVASEEDLRSIGFLFPASLRSNLAEEHLFLSVAIMPEGSTFTRSERFGCCLSLLLMSMVASAMWLGDETNTQVVQGFSLGPFSFTLNGVYTGIMTSLTCLPVIMAIVLLFQYSRPSNKGDTRVRDVEMGVSAELATQQEPAKGLPHWCKYVAWVLVVLSAVGSAVFTVLYSLEWGKEKSERWLSAYFTTFLVDMVLMQPAKILLLSILASSVRKTQVAEKMFEEKRGPASIEASAASSQREAGFNCDAFRTRRKMERLSMTSLANIKQARRRQRRDRRFGETVWDVAWFCCFLLLVLSIAGEHHNTTEGFHQTRSTTNTFLQSVDEVNDPLTFWSWLHETALESFYPETSYNGDKPRWSEKGFTADMQTVLVFPPSLIQGRVMQGPCAVPVTMQHLFDECSSAYDEHTKETGAFAEGWKRVRNASAMESAATGWTHLPSGYPSLPIYGVTTHYWGDGFGLHLGTSADEMRSILAELKANRWIDKRTRVIFLEAMLYNGNVDLFTSLTVVFEFSETAGVFSRHHVQTFRLRQRPGTMGYIYVLLEIIYVIILLYTLWREAKTARAAGLAYLKGPWNIVEIFNFFLAFVVIALYGFKKICSSKALVAIKEGKDQVHHLRSAVDISQVYGWFLAFLAFVNMMKFLRLLRFNPFLAKLMSVFRGMAGEFSSFMFHFFFWMSAFGVYAYLMFGLTVVEYSSISKSFSTLFQMSLGNFYYYQLREAAPILGPIFFFAFISIIFLVLMNIAMAIIDSALPDVRNHVMPEEDRYFIQGLWERFTAFFGFWKAPATDDDSMDTLHDSLAELEIKVEKLWLKRQSLFNLKMRDADLPAEPEFVPAVPDAAAGELHVRHRVIKVRTASPNSCTDRGSQATSSESKAPVVVASRSPTKEEDTPESRQTSQVRIITSVLSKGGKSDKKSTRRVTFTQVVLDRHTEERKVEWPGVKLSARDKVALTFGEMLTDNHIQAAQRLLCRQYPALQGLEAPAVGHCEDGFAKMTGKALQILHNGNMHWVLSSYTGGQVCLFDSLGVAMTPSLQIQLYQSYAAFADQARNVLTVIFPDVQRQKNVFDCGLFAIAWAVDIAEGQDVSRVVYDDRKMRSHLETCFEQGKLTPFPRLTSRRKVGPTKAHQISLVCRCEQGGRLGRMERCKACRRIFHVSCLPVSPPRDGTWACGDCAM
ncbi:polycystic kidney disease protein 1-like 2 [Branchiostoma floridae]|uniref:Polycystic kidney disease protein 1-like 2 n=2 Tax=Branchiostoma floridae TaxID=7739 RepID=A0A9J7KTG6_BRAFL|nr:polycystic kidney disease protein 1-like 2 [Branchiostoma floridae]